jgi:hypothetical protein
MLSKTLTASVFLRLFHRVPRININVFHQLLDGECRAPRRERPDLIEAILQVIEQRILRPQRRLIPRPRYVDDATIREAAPFAPGVAVVVNADDVPRRKRLDEKFVFFGFVHGVPKSKDKSIGKSPETLAIELRVRKNRDHAGP